MDIEQEARQLGWRPKEEFKGDPEKWVPAEDFVERGKIMMPLLRAENKKLEGRLETMSEDVKRLTQLFEASQESIAALKEIHQADTKAKVEKAKADLRAEIKRARAEEDVDAEIKATEQLSELNTAIAEAPKKQEEKKKEPEGAKSFEEHPEWKAWVSDNPWYGKDMRKTVMSGVIAQELRNDPKYVNLTGRAFMDKVSEGVEEFFSEGSTTSSKVESNRGGGGSKKGNSYNDLDDEAKKTCERQAAKMVGEGRAFKTIDDWRNYYAKMILEGE